MKAVEGKPTVYLFMSRKNEVAPCTEFTATISQSLEVFAPSLIHTFCSLFQYLMELATNRNFNLVINEFQEFYNINKSICSDI